ncbi:MAG: hypothetical protein K9I94_11045 [Bacteroidales bacterium]|nr:hypothetical protein [Bacteroidales bacterium]
MKKPDNERWLEILAVAATGALKFIMMDWLNLRIFYIVAASIFWLWFIYRRQKQYPGILVSWGFQKSNFKRSFLILLPFALVSIAGIVIYGSINKVDFLNWHVIPIFLLYPVWGVFQQFMIAGLVARNLKKLSQLDTGIWQTILITALLFALIHYPRIHLMVYVFFMEVIFLMVYFKWKNLWPLGLYHGWVSGLFLFFVMKRDLWSELWRIFM